MNTIDDTYLTEDQVARMKLPLEEAFNFPRAAYVSDHIYREESKHLFLDNWVNLAHVSELPNAGDYICVDVFDYPLVVTRGRNDDFHVMSRVCQHKGTLLAEGRGNASVFVCPFHAWSYNLDGSLKAAPLMEKSSNFDKSSCRLSQIPMEIWEGFIFVNVSGNAEPLAPQLEGLGQILANWNMADLVPGHEPVYYNQGQNWKINAESFLEAYHHLGAHIDTFQPTFPAANSHPIESSGLYSILGFGPAQASAATNIDGGDALPFIEGLTEDERMEPLVVFVWPSLLLGVGPDQVAYYRLMPTSAESHDLWLNDLMPRSTVEDPSMKAAIEARTEWATKIVHESDDMPVFDLCQKGIRSPFYEQGRLSNPYEKCIWEFNQWWLEKLEQHVKK